MGEKPTAIEDEEPGETSKTSNLNLSKSNINREAGESAGIAVGDEGVRSKTDPGKSHGSE